MSDPVTLTLSQVAELEALEKAATAGDWQANSYVAGPQKGDSIIEMSDGVGCDFYGAQKFTNAELVAASRNALPALLAAARELLELKSALDWLDEVGWCDSRYAEIRDKHRSNGRSTFTVEQTVAFARDLGWTPGAEQ
jgi:hypothetical protein